MPQPGPMRASSPQDGLCSTRTGATALAAESMLRLASKQVKAQPESLLSLHITSTLVSPQQHQGVQQQSPLGEHSRAPE